MSASGDYEFVTTDRAVSIYLSTNPIFDGVLGEVRSLSKKKPDAIMSLSKVRLVNRVLSDLKNILSNEPEGKYLDLLDEDVLPEVSDAVLTMVQFETALVAFRQRYYHSSGYGAGDWITEENIERWKNLEDENFEA